LIHFFEKFGLLTHFHITIGTMLRFLEEVYSEYAHVPFHNWNYAVGATQFLFSMLVLTIPAIKWEKLDLLVLLVAAICHGMGKHRRRVITNTKATFPLSILFPDAPVVQIFHCTAATDVLSKPSCDILADLTPEQQSEFWSGFIDCILSTDKSHHAKLLSEAEGRLRASNGAYDTANPAGKLLLMKLLVNCATVSGIGRAFSVSQPWARFLFEEAVSRPAGSDQAPLGTVAKTVANAQVKMMDEFCAPMFHVVARMVQPLQVVTDKIMVNVAVWKGLVIEKPES